MISFRTISAFSESVADLCSVKRGVYANVENEIRAEFTGKTIAEIRNNRDMILMSNESIVIKLRLPDKKHKLAKKDGYRLIYMVSKTKETVVFLDIYPKRGPKQQISLSNKRLTELLTIFVEEVKANTLSSFEMNTL